MAASIERLVARAIMAIVTAIVAVITARPLIFGRRPPSAPATLSAVCARAQYRFGHEHTGAEQSARQSKFRVFNRMGDLEAAGPSRTWLMIDERYDSIQNGMFFLQSDTFDPKQKQIQV